MTFPWTLPDSWALPDWLPWWGLLLTLIPAAIYLLLFLLMPFSVFGVKDRLEVLDARLDEIQGEIRLLTLRFAERGPLEPEPRAAPHSRPPIPPRPMETAWQPDPPEEMPAERAPRRSPERPARAEPRLDWPR